MFSATELHCSRSQPQPEGWFPHTSKSELATGSTILSPNTQERVASQPPGTISATTGRCREAELQMKASSPRQAAGQGALIQRWFQNHTWLTAASALRQSPGRCRMQIGLKGWGKTARGLTSKEDTSRARRTSAKGQSRKCLQGVWGPTQTCWCAACVEG